MSQSPGDTNTGRKPSLSMSLRQACRVSGFYGEGMRCPTCPIRHLCASEERGATSLTGSCEV